MTARLFAGALVLAAALPGGVHQDRAPAAPSGQTARDPSELWYVHGSLRAKSGHQFAFSAAFRRIELAKGNGRISGRSRWRARAMISAGIELADLTGHRLWHAERVERVALDPAGSARNEQNVTAGDWSLAGLPSRHALGSEIRLRSATPQFAVNVVNVPANRGDRPSSRGALVARGSIAIDGLRFSVAGDAWLEHRFSTTDESNKRWETFALELADGREVNLRVTPDERGRTAQVSGTLIERSGAVIRLNHDDAGVGEWAHTHWRSPHTGISYPSLWIVAIPRAKLSLTVSPVVGDQEVVPDADGRPYWGGPVDITDNTQRSGSTTIGGGWATLAGFGGVR